MKGNNQIFSKIKEDRIKGYKKLFKKKGESYDPPKLIAKDIVEAMEALGYDINFEQAVAYMKSSYAVFERRYHDESR